MGEKKWGDAQRFVAVEGWISVVLELKVRGHMGTFLISGGTRHPTSTRTDVNAEILIYTRTSVRRV